jgi:hypothetical protein
MSMHGNKGLAHCLNSGSHAGQSLNSPGDQWGPADITRTRVRARTHTHTHRDTRVRALPAPASSTPPNMLISPKPPILASCAKTTTQTMFLGA